MYSRPNILYHGRVYVFILIILLSLFSLIITFWYLQLVRGEHYRNLAKNNRIRRVRLSAPRGKIYDRNGVILVDNRPSYNVMIDYDQVSNVPQVVSELASILNKNKDDLLKSLKKRGRIPYMPTIVMKDITLQEVMSLEEHLYEIPGVFLDIEPTRNYCFETLAAQAIGYVGKISEEELKRLKDSGYHYLDVIGKSGIEYQYDLFLQGKAGGMQVQVDHRGRLDKVLSKKDPVPGKDLYLTIDCELQKEIELLFQDISGFALVVSCKTGEVLAMVSAPVFDPNIFIDAKRVNEVVEVLKNKKYPLINKTVMATYAPGSVFKIIIALTALKDRIINAHDSFYCSGTFQLGVASFKCWSELGHKWVKISEAIKHSCNVFFYSIGLKLNLDHLKSVAYEFGFGKKLGIDLPYEKSGLIPTPLWKKKIKKSPWYGGDTVNISIGQGYLLVTPLQIVMMMSAIANEGKLMQPFLMKKMVSQDEKYFKETNPKLIRKIKMEKEFLSIIKDSLFAVVNSLHGTGKLARLEQVKVSGKTGTVQLKTKKDYIINAWFAGYAPSDEPEIAFVFCVEEGESGGRTAAPLAQAALKKYFGIEEEEIQEENKTNNP
ncbi:penicillin-binding protein 2 [Chlamydiota bacterium]